MYMKKKPKAKKQPGANSRKALFGFMSKVRYPSTDMMILHLARKQTYYPPALNMRTPINIILPAQARAEVRPGAFQRNADQDFKPKAEPAEYRAEAPAPPRAEAPAPPPPTEAELISDIPYTTDSKGIRYSESGKSIQNPKSMKWIKRNASNIARVGNYIGEGSVYRS
jgi:hypothetical protein